MANTVNLGKSARVAAGRDERRFGGRFARAVGLATIVVVTLGLAAGAIINRTRTAAVPATEPAPLVNPYWVYSEDVPIEAPTSVYGPFASDPHVATVWDFREDRRDDGSAGLLPGPVAPGAVPTAPTILPGSCQPGTSDCPPLEYSGPPPTDYPTDGPR
jgi:hypothetical protein